MIINISLSYAGAISAKISAKNSYTFSLAVLNPETPPFLKPLLVNTARFLYFSELRNLQKNIINNGVTGIEMKELSMGMTDDFEIAIEEGATIVRIGRAIFGERK